MYAGLPQFYDHKNAYNASISPSTSHATNTALSWQFQRYLIQDAISVFEWELPENWDRDYMLYCLYYFGYVAVINTDKFGVIPQHCALSGYDVFYRPNKALIQNPLIKGGKYLTINRDCALIKLQPDYGGIFDIVSYYADLLALASETLGVNFLNSKLSYVFFASGKTSAESFKKLYDRVSSGEPASVVDKSLINSDGSPAWDTFQQNIGQNYIVDKVLDDMAQIRDAFRAEVGIPTANTRKRERLITDEVNANNVATLSKCDLWLEELQKGCRKASELFGVELSVDWRVKPDELQEVAEDE